MATYLFTSFSIVLVSDKLFSAVDDKFALCCCGLFFINFSRLLTVSIIFPSFHLVLIICLNSVNNSLKNFCGSLHDLSSANTYAHISKFNILTLNLTKLLLSYSMSIFQGLSAIFYTVFKFTTLMFI